MSAYLWHANASIWFTPKFMVQFTQNRQNGPTFGIGNRHFLAGESECQHTLACGPIVFNFSELKASLFCDISKPNWYYICCVKIANPPTFDSMSTHRNSHGAGRRRSQGAKLLLKRREPFDVILAPFEPT